MGTTSMLTSNAAAVKLWETNGLEDFVDQYKFSLFGLLYENDAVMESTKLNGRTQGDNITISEVGLLTGLGTGEGGIQYGNEEPLGITTDSFSINVLRHAVNSPSDFSIEQQRTVINFEKTSRKLLPGHLMSRIDQGLIAQLSGYTGTSLTVDGATYSGGNLLYVTGMNAATAPSSNRYLAAGGAANDQSLTSSNTMSLDLIDDALVLAGNTYPNIRMLDGEYFICLLSHKQWRDLKRDTTGKIQWYENALAMMKGGMINDNPIMVANGLSAKPVGQYANVMFYVSSRVTPGVNSGTNAPISTVNRALFLGKNSAIWGCPFGPVKGYGEQKSVTPPFKYVMQNADYEYYKGIGYVSIFGIKKILFNGQDFGSIVLSTYAN